MASHNEKRNVRANTYRTEIDGNVVRKVFVEPQYPERTEAPVKVHHRRRKEARSTMSIPYCLFLTVACVFTLAMGAYYLQQQALATSSQKKIATLEDDLAELKKDNADELNRINSSVNLEEIRDIAINELGMVYATEENVVLYKSTTQNYVSQYEKVPQEEDSLLKSIFKSE